MGPVLPGSMGCLRGPGLGWRSHCYLAFCPHPAPLLKPYTPACLQIKQPTATDLRAGGLQPRAKDRALLEPYALSRRETDYNPGNGRTQRRQQLKKPSSAGASSPAKTEVQGHSVSVAITASCFLAG